MVTTRHERNGNGEMITLNRLELSAIRRMESLLVNEIKSRAELIGSLTADRKDIDAECGYPQTNQLDFSKFSTMYDREGIARRIISIYPRECWSMSPNIYETEDVSNVTQFEKAWEDLDARMHIISKLEIADEISGIGRYGGLLLGFDDGGELDRPVPNLDAIGNRKGSRKYNLIYLTPLSEGNCQVASLESNIKSPRFGLPLTYTIKLTKVENSVPLQYGETATVDQKVHWTRIHHLADNRGSSDVYGTPRLQVVYNRVHDIRKILGADGEGYWKGGFPGLSLETHPNIQDPEIDKDKIKEEVKKYMDGMQRYLALVGMTAKSLAPQISDPSNHFETQIAAIAIAIDVPLRIFKGSEEAKLASSQDMRSWNRRLGRRQQRYVIPYVIRPLLDRLIAVGALPQPKQLIIKWPDLNAPTDNDRAVTAAKLTEALVKYVTGNAFLVIPPKEYLTMVLGYTIEESEKIISSAGSRLKKMMDLALKKMDTDAKPKPVAGVGKRPAPGKRPAKKPGAGEGAGRP